MAKMSTEEMLDAFKEMSLLELSEFVKAFEETFEVTAAAPVAVATTAAQPAEGTQELRAARTRTSSTSSSKPMAETRSPSSRRSAASRPPDSRRPRNSWKALRSRSWRRSTRKRPKRRRPPLKAPARRFPSRRSLQHQTLNGGLRTTRPPVVCPDSGKFGHDQDTNLRAYPILLDLSSIPGHHLGTHTPGADPSGRGLSRGPQGSGSLSPLSRGRSDRGTVGVSPGWTAACPAGMLLPRAALFTPGFRLIIRIRVRI